MVPRVWFITGASTGFGRSITELALKNGDIAVATLRKPEVLANLRSEYPADRLLILKVDVRVERDIVDAFTKTIEMFGRVDVVFNNAGYSAAAEVEGTPDGLARGLFETNFWGAANVSRQAVKHFRESNAPGVGGRLLQISSIVAMGSMPIVGYYSASKFALEGLTEALALEVNPKWNIKITMIEPGAFRTLSSTFEGNMKFVPAHPAYTDPSMYTSMFRQGIENMVIQGDPMKAAEAMFKIAGLENPPLRIQLGKDSVEAAKNRVASLKTETETYESWSEDLQFD